MGSVLEVQGLPSVVTVFVAGAMIFFSPCLWIWGPDCSDIISHFSMEEDDVHLYMLKSKLLLEQLKVTTTLTLDCQEGLGTSLYQPQYADLCNLD